MTGSPPVGSGASPNNTDKPSFPSESQDEQKDETTDGGESSGKKKNKKNKKKAKQDEAQTEADDEAEFEAVDTPIADVKLDTTAETIEEDKRDRILTPVEADDAGEGEETPRKAMAPKSPLLTSHRLSTASSLDEVNLTTNKDDEHPHQVGPPNLKSESPPVPPKDDVSSPSGSGLMGLSGSLPSLPWGPPPVNKNPPPAAPPPPPTRKPSGPFAWFSRSSTGIKDIKSPPPSGRRNTSTSVSTVASGLDLVDGDGSSVHSKRPRRNSLKDQFKLLRMREESGHPENDEGSVRSGHASISHAGASPPIIHEEGEDGILVAPAAAAASGATSPGGVTPSTINPGLAPGTVSGFSQSATDAAAPVDWDLWQQLVNNGPQALASSEELNAAIKRGIPQTIRGVIWQILADCRIGELEEIYRELVARGTDKDHRTPSVQINGMAEKESIPSSRSSIRSNISGSGTQSVSATPSPSHESDPEKMAKEQAASEAARLKKAKDEASTLSKLEKIIRRDLGARTSYSKYFVSQGSQESLFGLCKAYALYDEAVGYAQGMNFIVMPLLFNVSFSRKFRCFLDLID